MTLPPLTLHIGAHRTATTALQVTLRRLSEAGELSGLDYFGPHRLRPRFSRSMLAIGKLPPLARIVPLSLLNTELAKALRGPLPVLISEEASLGRVDGSLLQGLGPYPGAAGQLRALHRMLGRRPARVVLTIRSPADWYPSAYSMVALRRTLPPLAELAPEWRAARRGWSEIATAARGLFGTCDVFCFEGLRETPAALLASLTGGRAAEAPIRRMNQSHSADVLAALARARASGGRAGRAEAEALRRAEAASSSAQSAAAPPATAQPLALPRADAEHLHAAYLADIARMEQAGISVRGAPTSALWPIPAGPAVA